MVVCDCPSICHEHTFVTQLFKVHNYGCCQPFVQDRVPERLPVEEINDASTLEEQQAEVEEEYEFISQ